MRITRYEVRAAARTLVKHSAFSTVAILSLGIAIGLNTTMYSVLDALVNPKIAFPRPEQVYSFRFFGDYRHKIDARARNALIESTGSFAALTGGTRGFYGALLASDKAYSHGSVAVVLPNYFSVLEITPAQGRGFVPGDLNESTPPAIISSRLARDLFPHGANPLGQRIDVQDEAHVVIGVLDRAGDFPASRIDAWILPPAGTDLASISLGIGRVKDGVTREQLLAQLDVINRRMTQLTGETLLDDRVDLGGGASRGQFHVGGFHLAILGAVLAVLLVACANVANLQLARGIARSTELATRSALGASRRDIVLHLLLESALLGAAGLVVGVTLAFWGMHIVTATIPSSIQDFIVTPQTSWRLFAFAAAATVVCVLLVGLVPALRVSRVNLNDLIKRGAGTGSTKRARRQYGVLIAVEIGFALVVTCIAALLVRAARQLDQESHAFDRSKLVDVRLRVRPPAGGSWAVADVSAELVSRLRALRDVADVAVIGGRADKDKEVTATDPGGAMHVVPAPTWGPSVVTPSFMRAMGYGILHGRDFREGEQGAVAIVDARTARLLWPNTEAVGHMIKFGSPGTPGRWYTVIGVRKPAGLESQQTGDPKSMGAVYALAMDDDRLVGAAPYGLSAVNGYSPFMDYRNPQLEVVVRAARNPQLLPIAVRRALAADTRRFGVTFAGTFDELTGAKARLDNQYFVGTLFSVFALLALGLAGLGVYGIVSHSVAERRRELGVRLALGSSAREILYVVLREGNVFALAGVAIGLLLVDRGAWLVTQFLRFPEIDIYSVELYLPAAAFFFALAVGAALVPAWRATRIDPVEALRCE